MGYVYLLMVVDQNGDEVFKIGITKVEIQKRIKQLQTGNSSEIKLLKYYKSDNYKIIEKWLHARYGTKKTDVKNEWFHLTNEDVQNFIETCSKIESDIKVMSDNHFFKIRS